MKNATVAWIIVGILIFMTIVYSFYVFLYKVPKENKNSASVVTIHSPELESARMDKMERRL